MIIEVKVSTKAKKTELIPLSNGNFKAKLTVIPEKGKANEQLIMLISEYFKVPKSQISIKSGKTSKNKLIEL